MFRPFPNPFKRKLTIDYGSSVAVNGLAAYTGAVLGREEHHACRNLARLGWAAHRGGKFLLRLVVHC